MAGIYIHIPFCKQACYYCDFHFSTQLISKEKLINALAKEAELQRNYLGEQQIKTIYFGGGTPSILLINEIQELLNVVYSNFEVSLHAEVTLEVNPDDLSIEKLHAYNRIGINRLSIGIQSFDNNVLRFLNRAHDCSKAVQSIEDARQAGFDNISIDLIYSIPGQSLQDWNKNIELAMELSPEHISAYALTIEEKTVFGLMQKKGQLKSIDDEPSALQFELLMDTLEKNGFEHYEISNFCKPGFFSKHNSSYWNQETYLGLGPSAHSFNGNSRQFNVKNNSLYVKSIENNSVPYELESLTLANKINEYILTSIRTGKGCDLSKLLNDLHFNLKAVYNNNLTLLSEKGLLTVENDHLILSKKGKLVADKIAMDFFVED